MASQQSASQPAPNRPTRREAAWQAAKAALAEELGIGGPFAIGMEACSGAHFLGRQLRAQGHDARLMPPKYIQPYVQRDKTDWNDAEASAEACRRPTMRFVESKSEEQLTMQSLDRLAAALPGILEDAGNGLPPRRRELAAGMRAAGEELDRREEELNLEVAAEARQNEACRRAACPAAGR